jgi:DNA invertase Pin-like site-specific DNA recombinase
MLIQPYFRRSKADKKRRLSVELQREEFALWLAKQENVIPLPAREDDGKSAFTENPAARPAFLALMQDARARRFDAIWVYMYDRFSRKLALSAPFLEELDRLHIRVISATESEDWETRAQASLEAEKFSRKLSIRIRSAKQFDARRGIWVGAAPYGYNRHDGKLTPNEHGPIVTLIFDLFTTNGYSIMDIVDELKVRGITRQSAYHKDGESYAFGNQSIRQILTNRAYLGEVRCGDIAVPDAHAPLVDNETWQAVQEIRGRRAKHHGRLTIQAPDRGILTNTVKCAICGASMWYSKSGKGRRSYGCSQRIRYHNCENHAADTVDVDRYALHLLSRLQLPEDWQQQALSIVAAEQRQRPAPDAAQIERELRRLREQFMDEQIGIDQYRAREAALKVEQKATPPVTPVNLAKAASQLADLSALIAHATVDEQRSLIRTIFDRIWLRSSVIEAWTPHSAYQPLFATLYNEPPDNESSGGMRSRSFVPLGARAPSTPGQRRLAILQSESLATLG